MSRDEINSFLAGLRRIGFKGADDEQFHANYIGNKKSVGLELDDPGRGTCGVMYDTENGFRLAFWSGEQVGPPGLSDNYDIEVYAFIVPVDSIDDCIGTMALVFGEAHVFIGQQNGN